VTAGGIGKILANAQEISPAVTNLPIVDTWSGLRPRAPDNLPVLGPCDEIGGLFYATGHYRNGILLAPVTGELIDAAVVDGILSPLLGPFSSSRFRSAIGGLFYATGHYRNGILLAPVTGELIAAAVVDGILSPLLGPFSPSRF